MLCNSHHTSALQTNIGVWESNIDTFKPEFSGYGYNINISLSTDMSSRSKTESLWVQNEFQRRYRTDSNKRDTYAMCQSMCY